MANEKPHQSVYVSEEDSDRLIQEWLDTTHFYPPIEEEIPVLPPDESDEDE